jgi:hypothetical protein
MFIELICGMFLLVSMLLSEEAYYTYSGNAADISHVTGLLECSDPNILPIYEVDVIK